MHADERPGETQIGRAEAAQDGIPERFPHGNGQIRRGLNCGAAPEGTPDAQTTDGPRRYGVDLPARSHVARPPCRVKAIPLSVLPSNPTALAGTLRRTH
jgi:hypothetical protein